MQTRLPRCPARRDDFEIAIICALTCERNAVEAAFDEFWDEDGDRYGRANGDLNHYITGRDVIISKSVVQYDFGRQHPDKFVRKDSVEDNLGRANKDIRNLIAVFESDRGIDRLEERATQVLQELQQKLPRRRSGKYDSPGAAQDKLFKSDYHHKHQNKLNCICQSCLGDFDPVCPEALKSPCDDLGCDHSFLEPRPQRLTQSPAAHTGVIASGDLVLRSAAHRNKIFMETKAVAFEMEGAGVWDEVPCIVVKGVCDYADSHKHKGWQDYAAATAASERKEDCLRSLAFARLGARRHDIEPALAGTCDWLFATPEFREWCRRDRLADHHGVLWLKGKPGAGKSTLIKHALQYCQHHFLDHLIAAYFFNARGDASEKSPLGMLRSITYELIKHDDTIYRLFVPRYDDKTRLNGDKTRAGGRIMGLLKLYDWSFSELRDFLLEVIRWQGMQNGGAVKRPLLLLVDALDECSDDGVRIVVKTLETLSSCAAQANVTLRICLSSRYYPTITIQKHLPLYVDSIDGHSQDIAAYISDTLVGDNAELQAEIQRRADGVFLWVVLVVEQLNIAYDEGEIEAMWTALQSVPDNIEKIFEALRPLFLDELYYAIIWATGKKEVLTQHRLTSDDMRRRIISASRGLVEVRKPKSENLRNDDEQRFQVQFIHLSVNDFLFRQGRLGQLDPTLGPDPVSATHGRLWAICWRYIKQCIAWDHNDSVQRRPSAESVTQLQHDYPFLGYATRYIFAHADKAVSRPINIGGPGDPGLAARADSQEAVVSWLEKQATGLEWWVGFVRATAGDYETRENIDADLLYILSFGGYSNLARIVLATEQLRIKTDLNAQAQVGDYGTALCAAAARGSTKIVRILLAAGADVHLQAQVGDYGTALCAAAAGGSTETVQILLAAGADVHLQAHFGCYGTALCAAAAEGEIETVQILLAAGADVNFQAQVGHYGTALCAAQKNGYRDIEQLLLEAGIHPRSSSPDWTNTLIETEAQATATTQTAAPVEDAAIPAPAFLTGRIWRRLGLSAVAALLLSYVFDFFVYGESYGSI
ncbi:uncharacterized protein J7T54_003339 [Emericellopsis cladophorae]|uniref:Nephrocystin 3-like N-terminal domain-containing protein n=1 Tax=Emericellopsis cladophorae TaxID=2686198 RepID=A0A9P9XV11_9HYPO|nr:uncharacterized protein J7T54_003339 [Emericellopsis cladophorae]KAI6778332.1 hypothetical protein J7T54_003339 [Emericellopsis cladophorae]